MRFKCPKCDNWLNRLYILHYLGYGDKNTKGYPVTSKGTNHFICMKCDKIRKIKVTMK